VIRRGGDAPGLGVAPHRPAQGFVQHGGNDAAVHAAGVALMAVVGQKTAHAGVVIDLVEMCVQAGGILHATHKAHV